MVLTLIGTAVVVLLPGLAAAWWTRRGSGGVEHAEDHSPEPSQLVALVYAGVGVASITLWLGAVVFGLNGWTSVAIPVVAAGMLALGAARGMRSGCAATRRIFVLPTSHVSERLGRTWRYPVGVLSMLSVIAVCVVAVPFATYGVERADGIHRMAMTDWEKHIVMRRDRG